MRQIKFRGNVKLVTDQISNTPVKQEKENPIIDETTIEEEIHNLVRTNSIQDESTSDADDKPEQVLR